MKTKLIQQPNMRQHCERGSFIHSINVCWVVSLPLRGAGGGLRYPDTVLQLSRQQWCGMGISIQCCVFLPANSLAMTACYFVGHSFEYVSPLTSDYKTTPVFLFSSFIPIICGNISTSDWLVLLPLTELHLPFMFKVRAQSLFIECQALSNYYFYFL